MSYRSRHSKEGLFVCEICNRGYQPDKSYQLICPDCLRSLKRFENEKGSGDTYDILVWAARRARVFKARTGREFKRGFLKAISIMEERLSVHELRDARLWLKENA